MKQNRTTNKSLFLVNDFPPILGGQATYYFYLTKAFPPKEIIVCTPKIPGSQKIDETLPFKIIRINFFLNVPIIGKLLRIIYSYFQVKKIMREENVSILHCAHILSTGIVGLLLHSRYIIYTHSADILQYRRNPFFNYLLKKICHNAYKIVSNSSFTKSIVIDLGLAPEKIQVIYPKINIEQFHHPEPAASTKKFYQIESQRPILLSINRLVERKGNDTVIRSLPIIKKEFPNILYLIVGEGAYEKKLRELVQQLDLQQNVKILKCIAQTELKNLYNICDIFVMVSRLLKKKGDAEGFGIVFLEANALKKPTIGGMSGGVPEAVIHNETGLCVDELSCDAVAQAVIKLLKNPDLSKQYGETGFNRLQQKFNWTLNSSEIKHLLES